MTINDVLIPKLGSIGHRIGNGVDCDISKESPGEHPKTLDPEFSTAAIQGHGHTHVSVPIFSVGKRGDASDRTSQNQGVHIVCAFVGVDHFQIHQVVIVP
jgi:hypothetical protein